MRPYCSKCQRPQVVCYCPWLQEVRTMVRVVILMHPDEQRRRVATGRMAHLCLPNSDLLVGEDFRQHRTVQEALSEGGCHLLFPGATARDSSSLVAAPSTVFVIDGKWAQANKILGANPWLADLPRLSFQLQYQSLFTIKRQPKGHCLSTIEAIACLLSQISGEPNGESLKLLVPFFHVVNQQLEFEFGADPG